MSISLQPSVAQEWIPEGPTLTQSANPESQYPFFAVDMALSDDGSTLVIGEYGNGEAGTYAGKVFVYQNVNDEWVPKGAPLYGDNLHEYFGYRMSLDETGNTLIISKRTFNDRTMIFQAYSFVNGAWVEKGDEISVANNWNDNATVSLNADGSIMAIGIPYTFRESGTGKIGSFQTYSWDGSNWAQMGSTIIGENGGYLTGDQIVINGDGDILAVKGTASGGLVTLYQWQNTDWSKVQEIHHPFTNTQYWDINSLDIDKSGDKVAIGLELNLGASSDDNGSGLVYIYERNGSSYTLYQNNIIDYTSPSPYFGDQVAISADGNTVAVSNYYNVGNKQVGNVNVFGYTNGNTWSKLGNPIDSTSAGYLYGNKIDINEDGSLFAVAARFDHDKNSGILNLFKYQCIDYVIPMTITECLSYNSPAGNTHTTSGIYYDTLSNACGLDSVIVTDLTVYNGNTYDTINPVACGSYLSPSGLYTYTEKGRYNDTLSNFCGADSVITIDLAFESSTAQRFEYPCGPYTLPSGNKTVFENGTYYDTIPNTCGGDSILTIIVRYSNSITYQDIYTCTNHVSPSGKILDSSGTFEDIIPRVCGGDSIIRIRIHKPEDITDVNEQSLPFSLSTENMDFVTNKPYCEDRTESSNFKTIWLSYKPRTTTTEFIFDRDVLVYNRRVYLEIFDACDSLFFCNDYSTDFLPRVDELVLDTSKTYYIRIGYDLDVDFTIKPIETNTSCNNAITLTEGETIQQNFAYTEGSLWYEFTSTSGWLNFLSDVETGTLDMRLGYGCSNMQINLTDVDSAFTYARLESNSPFYINLRDPEFSSTNTSSKRVTLGVTNIPGVENDSCIAAAPLVLPDSNQVLLLDSTLYGATNDQSTSKSSAIAYYSFIPKYPLLYYSTESSVVFDLDTICPPSNSLFNNDNYVEVVPGKTYYLECQKGFTNINPSADYRIELQQILPQENDSCVSAQNLELPKLDTTVKADFNLQWAYKAGVTCDNYRLHDVWYKFTAISSAVLLDVKSPNDQTVYLSINEGCSNEQNLICRGSTTRERLFETEPGKEYWVSIGKVSGMNESTEGTLSISAVDLATNLTCEEAKTVEVKSTCDPTKVQFDRVKSETSLQRVWYTFTATEELVTLEAIQNADIDIYIYENCSRSIAPDYEQFASTGNNIKRKYQLELDKNYYVVVQHNDFDRKGVYSDFCLYKGVVENDSCHQAKEISEYCAVVDTVDFSLASPGVTPACGHEEKASVWYSFTTGSDMYDNYALELIEYDRFDEISAYSFNYTLYENDGCESSPICADSITLASHNNGFYEDELLEFFFGELKPNTNYKVKLTMNSFLNTTTKFKVRLLRTEDYMNDLPNTEFGGVGAYNGAICFDYTGGYESCLTHGSYGESDSPNYTTGFHDQWYSFEAEDDTALFIYATDMIVEIFDGNMMHYSNTVNTNQPIDTMQIYLSKFATYDVRLALKSYSHTSIPNFYPHACIIFPEGQQGFTCENPYVENPTGWEALKLYANGQTYAKCDSSTSFGHTWFKIPSGSEDISLELINLNTTLTAELYTDCDNLVSCKSGLENGDVISYSLDPNKDYLVKFISENPLISLLFNLDITDADIVDTDNDGVPENEDCNDNDPQIGAAQTWYLDADSDGLGNPSISEVSCTMSSGYVANNDDTNDNDADNDGVETGDDCDDNDENIGAATTWYLDADGDGLGSTSALVDCNQPDGYVDNSNDNNDNDTDNDGINSQDDCNDNDVNIGEATLWYADVDEDGVGDASVSLSACTPPPGYVASSGDNCPNDGLKLNPGTCGCGEVDTDTDSDGTPDCQDQCPADANKTLPGNCGCGNTEESCLDCNNEPKGTAEYDNCGECVGGTTGLEPCVQDCHGDWGGSAVIDVCENCSGGNTGMPVVNDPENCIATSVVDEFALDDIQIYPNPFNQKVTVISPYSIDISISTVTGKDIAQYKNVTEIQLGDNYANGVYIFTIRKEDQFLYKRVVKH